jgi:hypothetical protein
MSAVDWIVSALVSGVGIGLVAALTRLRKF